MTMWLTWLIVGGFFFVLEIITTGFLVFWIGIGALLAMIISFFVDNLVVQMVAFVVSSTILIILTKPLTNKFFNTKTIATNSYSLIGKKAIVTENIDSIQGKGKVKINGEVWSAKTTEDKIIPKDTEVNITEITGVKLVVTTDKNI